MRLSIWSEIGIKYSTVKCSLKCVGNTSGRKDVNYIAWTWNLVNIKSETCRQSLEPLWDLEISDKKINFETVSTLHQLSVAKAST